MLYKPQSVMVISLLSLFVLSLSLLHAGAGRWGAYDSEQGAWGGNGGWWGGGHSDWYGQGGWPEERDLPRNENFSLQRGYQYNGYYYDNAYPYSGEHIYPDTVDGGALYVNIE